ncbi:hypothetical protein [Simplicispira psychrophila]|uniref:hypothetical protein n=1 Tax=Simplicispira psychrophila TaxID=80882 RepID=UPI0004815253|nr:hypothetical protein [Simplicispira psychrophila]
MTKPPMFKQDPNDREGGYLLSMAGVLALMGATAYEADDAVTPQGRANAKYGLARILSAARAGGFTQGDLLDTLFFNGEVSERLRDMVHAAVDAAGNKAMLEVVASLQERCDD